MSFKTYRFAPEIVVLCFQDWVYGNEEFANVVAATKMCKLWTNSFHSKSFPVGIGQKGGL